MRYQLLDIEVIIRKTLVFAGLLAMVMAVTGTVTLLMRNFVGHYFPVSQAVSMVLSMMVVILVYERTRVLLVNLTDRFLFQKSFDYKALLKEASQQMAEIKSLRRLSRVIVGFLIKKARIKAAATLVRADVSSDFLLMASRPAISSPLLRILSKDHILVQYLQSTKEPVEIRALEEKMGQGRQTLAEREVCESLLSVLHHYGAQVAIPSFLGKFTAKPGRDSEELQLKSILFLGPQKSDKDYTAEDLDVFFTLAQESAIAIENARLYDEAVKRSRELEEMNTELLNANEKLRVTQASLIVAEKSATMVGMAKAIGHEINNPLATVSGRTFMIEREYKTWEGLMQKYSSAIAPEDSAQAAKAILKSRDNLQRIDRSAKRIGVVVQTLTNILKNTKGEMQALSLLVLAREAIEAVRFSTYESNLMGCKIEEEIKANIFIVGNLEQLIQVFVNLVKNAREAMDGQKDARITIRGNFDPDDRKMARIEFADNGPGIPVDVMPKIWMQGFSTKVKKDESLGAAGQGQGLFVVKHIVESIHKGTIQVASEAGCGTTFTVRLPLAEGEEREDGQAAGG